VASVDAACGHAWLALARRLIDVLWALLHDDREFTPEKPITATAAA
jgi:hypothetical protein